MKWGTAIILGFLLAALAGVPAAAQTQPPAAGDDQAMEGLIGALDLSEVNRYLEEIDRQLQGGGGGVTVRDMVNLFTGRGGGPDFKAIGGHLLSGLFREIAGNARLLAQLLVLSVICALLINLQSSFEREATGKLALTVCYLVLITLAVGTFSQAAGVAKAAIDSLVGFMQAMMPILLPLLIAAGGPTSAALLHPFMVFVTQVVGILAVDIVFPLIFFAAMLDIIGSAVESVRVSHLSGLLRMGAITVLGLGMSAFLGVMVVQGAAGSVADGIALRTAKFATSTFIPVIGKMFADATELIFGSTLLLKNAVGLAGLVGVFLLAAFPLFKILALIVIYRLAAALSQPIGAGRLAECLDGMGNSLVLVFVTTASVALMFFVAITVIVVAGNAAAMMR